MSQPETKPPAASPPPDEVSVAESGVGRALVLIHRLASLLDQPDRAMEAQSLLHRAAAFLESARQAHARDMGLAVGAYAQTSVDSETVAVIAAAITTLLGRPYKLVSVQPVQIAVPHANVWALEGRAQLLQSHKIR